MNKLRKGWLHIRLLNRICRGWTDRQIHDQSGATAVVAALTLVALLGFSAFVLDLGVSYNHASKLQNALDSAVLAAVKELPAENVLDPAWFTARNEAVRFASLNGYEITADDIEPIYKEDIASSTIIGIKISRSIEVEYAFARVLGINSGTVTRTASAGIVPAGAITGAVPLSITSSSLSSAIAAGVVTDLTIKCSSDSDAISIDIATVSGWFGALRFDGVGANDFSRLLSTGYSGVLTAGTVLDIETGNMSGPTMDGFTSRYTECTNGCTADHFEPNCPRITYIPVIEILESRQVKVVGFAPFFLDEIGGNGNNSYIKATYIPGTVLPNRASGTSGEDYGVYVSKLMD